MPGILANIMQTDFQIAAHRVFAECAQRHQLEPYPLVESGNGTEYKNYRNDTVFTVYHDRLDAANQGHIELAIGVDNIATELALRKETVDAWLSRMQLALHPAESKSPQWWPRLSLWSFEEVQQFCDAFDSLVNSRDIELLPEESRTGKPVQVPPIDERVMREILTRRGQEEFRSELLRAYSGRCAISGCTDVEVLEAAHITPHSETQDYSVFNGLLLRADLHTLFDLRLVSIDPRTARVVVSRRLGAMYQPLNGSVAKLPVDVGYLPNASSLLRHFNFWQAGEQDV